MKTKDCNSCRKAIYKEAETAYLKEQYRYFEGTAYSMAVFTAVAAMAVFHRRKYSKKYIQKFFEDFCFIVDCPEVFGKRLDMCEMAKFFQKEYDIDFNEITLHIESEKEFIKGVRKDE